MTWIGFDQQQSLHEYSWQAALPLWMEFMQEALQGVPVIPQEQPPDVISIRIDPVTGKRTSAKNSSGIFEYFMKPYFPEKDPSSDSDTSSNADSTNDSHTTTDGDESLY